MSAERFCTVLVSSIVITPSATNPEPRQIDRRRSMSLPGVASAAGFLVCLFSLTGFAGRWHWLFEITSHFRGQYAVILPALAVVLLWKRRPGAAAVFIAFAALNGWLLVPFLFGPPTFAATASSPTIRLLSWNVNSANRNFAELERLIRAHDPDVVLVIEVDSEWQVFLNRAMTRFAHQLVEARDDNFGIALYSRTPLNAAKVVYLGTAGLPSIAAELTAGDHQLTLLATHPLPPAGGLRSRYRDDQLAAVARWTRQQTNGAVVVGDLNITPWSPVFAELLDSSRLQNSSEGRGLNGTWPAFFPALLIPIDHFLHTDEVTVTRREVLKARGSDHRPQLVEFGMR